MELRQLATFIRVAQFKSFSRAAESLGYSQSAVTVQIRQLEEELDTRLFDRMGKRIALTDTGERFLSHACDVMNQVNQARMSVTSTAELHGSLHIGTIESLACLKLPTVLHLYRKFNPKVSIRITVGEPEDLIEHMERGELDTDAFLGGITAMLTELTRSYRVVPGAEVLFPSGREVIGRCPRCGSDVTESKKGYFCERNDCHFGLWRDNRFLAAKKINLTKKMAETLLKDGKTYASGIFSEKTGKTYDAYIVLEDDGTKTAYRLEFERGKTNGKQYS